MTVSGVVLDTATSQIRQLVDADTNPYGAKVGQVISGTPRKVTFLGFYEPVKVTIPATGTSGTIPIDLSTLTLPAGAFLVGTVNSPKVDTLTTWLNAACQNTSAGDLIFALTGTGSAVLSWSSGAALGVAVDVFVRLTVFSIA